MTDQPRIRVLTVDDHPLFLEGIATLIQLQPDMTLVAHVASGGEAIQAYRTHRPDVTLMDIRLPDLSGIDALIAIRAFAPGARIVMLTTFEGGDEVQRALHAGARAYIVKDVAPRVILETIREVHAAV